MVENDRADSLYIITTPDVDSGGETLTEDDVINQLDGMYDSNYSATYWPWIQVNDAENNVYIWLPSTRDVVRNIAWENINIFEIVSTNTELTFILNKKDAVKGYTVLEKLVKK
jgi:hypothetical protein